MIHKIISCRVNNKFERRFLYLACWFSVDERKFSEVEPLVHLFLADQLDIDQGQGGENGDESGCGDGVK